MQDEDVFAVEAADVAMQAIKEGLARVTMTWDEAYQRAKKDIEESRSLTKMLMEKDFIKEPLRGPRLSKLSPTGVGDLRSLAPVRLRGPPCSRQGARADHPSAVTHSSGRLLTWSGCSSSP